MGKVTAMLLAVLLAMPVNATAKQPLKTSEITNLKYAGECKPYRSGCTCYTQTALSYIADRLEFAELCLTELDLAQDYIEQNYLHPPQVQWYQEPAVIIGGTVVSFALGGLLVWGLTR